MGNYNPLPELIEMGFDEQTAIENMRDYAAVTELAKV